MQVMKQCKDKIRERKKEIKINRNREKEAIEEISGTLQSSKDEWYSGILTCTKRQQNVEIVTCYAVSTLEQNTQNKPRIQNANNVSHESLHQNYRK